MKLVGKPDAGDRHIRFDERGWETGRWPTGPKLPRLSSTLPLYACGSADGLEVFAAKLEKAAKEQKRLK